MAGGSFEDHIELIPAGSRLARRRRLTGSVLIALLALAGPLLVASSGRSPPLIGWAMFLMFMPLLPFWLHVGAGGLAVRVSETEGRFEIGKSSPWMVLSFIGVCLGLAVGGAALLTAAHSDLAYAATRDGMKARAVGVMMVAIFGPAVLLLTATSVRRGGLIVDASGIRRRPNDRPMLWPSIKDLKLTHVERLDAFRLDVRRDGSNRPVQVYVPSPTSPAGQRLVALLQRYHGVAP